MSDQDKNKDAENYDKLYYASLSSKSERKFNPVNIMAELGGKPLSRAEIEIAEGVWDKENNDMGWTGGDYYPRNITEKSFQSLPYDKEKEKAEFQEMMGRNKKIHEESRKNLEGSNKAPKEEMILNLGNSIIFVDLDADHLLKEDDNFKSCPLFKLRKQTHALEKKFMEGFKEFDMSYTRFMTLWGCNLIQSATIPSLVKKLEIDKRTVALALEDLEDFECVDITLQARPYKRYWSVNQKGKELFLKMVKVWDKFKNEE